MEISSISWFSELGMEDPSFMHQYQMNSLEQFSNQKITSALGDEDFHHPFSSESYTSYLPLTPRSGSTTFSCTSMEPSHAALEPPTKQFKPNNWSARTGELFSTVDSSPSNLLSFGSENLSHNCHRRIQSKVQSEVLISQGSPMNQSYAAGAGQALKNCGGAKPVSHTHDHILAERKRREKLTQRFIALSAIVPGLKKMDKASVLGEAIKYMKYLQDRVKTLEEQTVKNPMESVVFVNKSTLSGDDDSSSIDNNSDGRSDECLLEIEARVSEKDVLIRIHCEKKKGSVVKTLAEIEKHHLSIVSTSVMPFADSALNITVTAQMEEAFCMTVKDLVKSLRVAFSNFM